MREIKFRGFHPDENGKEKVFVKMTNYDRIKDMSVEEMAGEDNAKEKE